jgi:DNA-binding HxlR family transcriptional regulator
MRGYGQPFCPITRASEIFATRWTPIIVRNLLLGCRTFGELQTAAPGIPRSLLTERLQQLQNLDIVARSPNPDRRGWIYQLTDAGHDLAPVCDALGTWGARWLEAAPEHFDAHVVLWSLCRLTHADDMPTRRLVIRFELRDGPKRRIWVVLCPPDSEVCVKPPGYDEDLVVETDTEWLAKWHMGRITLGQAMHDGLISVQGPTHLVQALSGLGLSRFADVEPAFAPGC